MDDVTLMGLAIEEAGRALAHHDVPVGALVVRGGEVIASRHNERELTGDPTAHAEILALHREGRIRTDVQRIPLSGVPDALAALEARTVTGRLAMVPGL